MSQPSGVSAMDFLLSGSRSSIARHAPINVNSDTPAADSTRNVGMLRVTLASNPLLKQVCDGSEGVGLYGVYIKERERMGESVSVWSIYMFGTCTRSL